jgi:transcriptional regulator with XRE-family HTH domain
LARCPDVQLQIAYRRRRRDLAGRAPASSWERRREGRPVVATDTGSDRSQDALGGYIRAQRELAALSLRQLADMSHVSNAYLSQVERGLHQPSLKVLRSIANALNVSAESLLTQAGLIDPDSAGPGTEAAILADLALTEEEKQVLLGLYRRFRSSHE